MRSVVNRYAAVHMSAVLSVKIKGTGTGGDG